MTAASAPNTFDAGAVAWARRSGEVAFWNLDRTTITIVTGETLRLVTDSIMSPRQLANYRRCEKAAREWFKLGEFMDEYHFQTPGIEPNAMNYSDLELGLGLRPETETEVVSETSTRERALADMVQHVKDSPDPHVAANRWIAELTTAITGHISNTEGE